MIKDKILRMIDANLNRVTEGIRVAEDVVRFVLDDAKLTSRMKDVRHKIVKLEARIGAGKLEVLDVRDVKRDVGAKKTTRSESKRRNILDVFMANIKRAQESVRVFEEISKLYDPGISSQFKKLRFELYDIEQKASILLKKKIKLDFNIYVITDPSFGRTHLDIMKQAASGGAKIVQLRDKDMPRAEYLKTAKNLSKWAKKHGITFIVNDYPDIALRSGADGVHVGKEIGAKEYQKIRKTLGDDKLIGVSASNMREAFRAQRLGADYIGLGPIFETPIKKGVKPVKISVLKQVMKRVTIPVVAIGGINRSNISQILSTGCSKAAVIRAIAGEKDVAGATGAFIKMFEKA